MPELTDSVVETLLPAGEPPELLPEGVSRDFFNARLRARATELERRIFQWLTLYQAIAERRQMDREFPGYQFTTCGFVPVSGNVSADLRTVGGYVFGIAVELAPTTDSPLQTVELVTYESVRVPCVINRRSPELHIANPISPNGTGACWARSKKNKCFT
jgi:hypothetical protein